jgi:hypothetical protein
LGIIGDAALDGLEPLAGIFAAARFACFLCPSARYKIRKRARLERFPIKWNP